MFSQNYTYNLVTSGIGSALGILLLEVEGIVSTVKNIKKYIMYRYSFEKKGKSHIDFLGLLVSPSDTSRYDFYNEEKKEYFSNCL